MKKLHMTTLGSAIAKRTGAPTPATPAKPYGGIEYKDRTGSRTIVQRLEKLAQQQPSLHAQHIKSPDGTFTPRNFDKFIHEVYRTAHYLQKKCGVRRGRHIALICDNRPEWLLFDLAILGLGAVDVPRGSDTVPSEIAYIIEHGECDGAVFETRSVYDAVRAIKPSVINKLSFVIFIEDNAAPDTHSYTDIQNHKIKTDDVKRIQEEIARGRGEDVATIIYTSGTTAYPKGVCLTHRGFPFQVDQLVPHVADLRPNHVLLSALPVWHSYERTVQYVALSSGISVAYSKPIGKILLGDLAAVQAQWMTSVPRIWEGVYAAIHKKIRAGSVIKKKIFAAAVSVGVFHEKIKHTIKNTYPDFSPSRNNNRFVRLMVALPLFVLVAPLRAVLDTLVFKKIRALLGKRFLAAVSGGGALPPHVDWFFQAARITMLEGYGLTESAPMLSARHQYRPEANSVGKIFSDIEYKILDETSGQPVPNGTPGILHVRSPQVMTGYYKDEKNTRAVLTSDGWLNTGDIVVHDRSRALKIVGRATEILVLKSGENVSPTRVENELKESRFIENAIVFGDNQKYIAALIIGDIEALAEECGETQPDPHDIKSVEIFLKTNPVRRLISNTVTECNKNLNVHERITKFTLLPHDFIVGEELTQTLKFKRRYIAEKYADIIAPLF